jgi:hypothetical protein
VILFSLSFPPFFFFFQNDSPSGRFHAELQNNDTESQPSPLSLSFMSDDLETVISGILVMEGDRKVGGSNQNQNNVLSLGRLIYRVKSGIMQWL